MIATSNCLTVSAPLLSLVSLNQTNLWLSRYYFITDVVVKIYRQRWTGLLSHANFDVGEETKSKRLSFFFHTNRSCKAFFLLNQSQELAKLVANNLLALVSDILYRKTTKSGLATAPTPL